MKTLSRYYLTSALVLAAHAGLLAWAATRHSPSVDEVGHMPSGLSHWELGSFAMYRVNPPLVRVVATAPVLACDPLTDFRSLRWRGGRPEFNIGREFVEKNGANAFWYFTLARWACIPFSLLGGYVCLRWGDELYGRPAGLLALTLWCFCPNVLAHAQMITPDAGAAALGVTAAYTFWRWLKCPSWPAAVLAGVCLGLAELSKTTWAVLFLLWPALWLAWRLPARRGLSGRAWTSQAGQLGVVLAAGLFLLNLGYGFDGSGDRLGAYPFVSTLGGGPGGESGALTSHNRWADTPLGTIPVPLPRDYVMGVDDQKWDFERKRYSYLRGEWRLGGWWYYYLYGLAIKVPLGTWAIAVMAVILALGTNTGRLPWRDELVLLAPPIVVLTLVSSQTGINHHLRYVLPAFPFAFLLVSRVARAASHRDWRVVLPVALFLVWSVTSSLAVYPHSLSYFNEAVGGPRGGPAHLVDSNVDWGQDVLHLRRWLDEHPEARPLHLAYFGQFDPRAAGIEYALPPRGPVDPSDLTDIPPGELGPRPGWYAVSVTLLMGYKYNAPTGSGGLCFLDKPVFTYFQRFEPEAMAGYSIYIYRITDADANRARREMNLPELPPGGG